MNALTKSLLLPCLLTTMVACAPKSSDDPSVKNEKASVAKTEQCSPQVASSVIQISNDQDQYLAIYPKEKEALEVFLSDPANDQIVLDGAEEMRGHYENFLGEFGDIQCTYKDPRFQYPVDFKTDFYHDMSKILNDTIKGIRASQKIEKTLELLKKMIPDGSIGV